MNSSLAVVRNRKVAALSGPVVSRLVVASGTDATMRFLNFFATQIENDNSSAVVMVLAWAAAISLTSSKTVPDQTCVVASGISTQSPQQPHHHAAITVDCALRYSAVPTKPVLEQSHVGSHGGRFRRRRRTNHPGR
jgi:hypothetical protein